MKRRPAAFAGRRRIHPFEDVLPTQRQIRMCFGKRMMNKQQAIQLVAYMRKHHDATDALNWFKCRVCGRYHIGNDYGRMEQ
jgi:hypothetical protein